ncbi:hypothetical protein PC116_g25599 [Phytophthora cactorum]|uniref:Uncharacterized protein n=1 Tax=Phytophthora cactorum TaxID=29920 RepID=A0A8T1BE05_9STRA|nr:hypothetical protein PC111_g19353 [Phytophthora cactorum]KAG2809418.1 hypothetical protein PC112_g16513 [Phytophthora cactorum]KAG2875746.1 hypothetical protein PC114_g24552 [Phytophthora cactorum]KAG2899873.1 hypothetical protein PC115_g16404 [Phytophthora cactorum]KAG2900989.1 hypothetical protein PC117_g21837 [Phytophthora cactorum]
MRRNDLNIVQWILSHFSWCKVEREVVGETARRGRWWVLQLLETINRIEKSTKLLYKAVARRQIPSQEHCLTEWVAC